MFFFAYDFTCGRSNQSSTILNYAAGIVLAGKLPRYSETLELNVLHQTLQDWPQNTNAGHKP